MGILGSKDKKTSTFSAVKDMGNAPNTAYERAEMKFLEIYGSAKIESSRWFVVAIVGLLVICVLGLAIYQIMPLKTVIPYMVSASKDTGAVAQPVKAQRYAPDESVKSYFLTNWIEKMRTLDPYQTPDNIKLAYLVTRDKASHEFTEYLEKEKPIQRLVNDRSLTRVEKFISINSGGDESIAFIRVREEERSGPNAMSTKNYMFTIHYVLTPPQSEEEIRKNPLGMYITHFVKSEEIGS